MPSDLLKVMSATCQQVKKNNSQEFSDLHFGAVPLQVTYICKHDSHVSCQCIMVQATAFSNQVQHRFAGLEETQSAKALHKYGIISSERVVSVQIKASQSLRIWFISYANDFAE